MVGIFVARRHFNEQKRQFDVSGLPYYFRLPAYSGKLTNDPSTNSAEAEAASPVKEVKRFVYMRKSRARHLLLYGPTRSHKTTLAAAIGSRLTIRRQAVRYLSKARLTEEIAVSDLPTSRTTTEPVHCSKADIVIIDDVIIDDRDQPESFKKIFSALAGKSTVWVVSSSKRGDLGRWISLVRDGLSGRLVPIKLEPKHGTSMSPSLLVKVFAVTTFLVASISVIGAIALLIVLQPGEFFCIHLSLCAD